VIETRTALIYLLDPGIVIVRIKKDLLQTLDDAEKNLSAAIRETGGQRRPLLLDLRQAMPLDDDLRRQYSGPRVVDNFSALGLVVDEGPFGQMMANLYLESRTSRSRPSSSRLKGKRSPGCMRIDHPQVDGGARAGHIRRTTTRNL
jgi:hypothetical protein